MGFTDVDIRWSMFDVGAYLMESTMKKIVGLLAGLAFLSSSVAFAEDKKAEKKEEKKAEKKEEKKEGAK